MKVSKSLSTTMTTDRVSVWRWPSFDLKHGPQLRVLMQEMDVLLGKEVQISVNPEIQITSEIVRSRFSPEERGCYFDGELELRYLEGYRYSLANCLYSSTVERVIERCHCVPHLLPLNTSHHSLSVASNTAQLHLQTVITNQSQLSSFSNNYS